MTLMRRAKLRAITQDIPDLEVDDPTGDARVLVLGWGSTYGPITAAARRVRLSGRKVALAHLRHLNPMPANLGDILHSYEKVVVPEMNLGQLAVVLQARHAKHITRYSRVRGLPISLTELERDLNAEIDDTTDNSKEGH